MSRKPNSRPARERSDVAPGAIPPPSLGASSLTKIAETSGMTTAVGAAAFGVLHARDGQAGFSVEKSDLKKSDQKYFDADANAGSKVTPGADQASTPIALGNHPQDMNPPAQAQLTQVPTEHQAAPSVEKAHLPDVVGDMQSIAANVGNAPEAYVPQLIQQVAHQMTASISDILGVAAKGEMTPAHVEGLAQSIVQTATGIVEDIKAHLIPVAGPSMIGDVAEDVTNAVQGLATDISHQVDDIAAGSSVIDLLDGALAPSASISQSVNEIVAGLSGLNGDLAKTSAEAISHAADIPDSMAGTLTDVAANSTALVQTAGDIPASLLGGHDLKGGPLTSLFYDDGGSSSVLEHVSDVVAPASVLADVGFAGQPLDAVSDLTGIFHGGSALHLV